MSELGQKLKSSGRAYLFRFSAKNGHRRSVLSRRSPLRQLDDIARGKRRRFSLALVALLMALALS
jgi:hypothetical protein